MRRLVLCAFALSLPVFAAAHGPGGMGGMGSPGAMGGPGMLAVAHDGSLLVTDMSSVMMGGGGQGQMGDRELLNVTPSGQIRWRVSFDDGWPMMPARSITITITRRPGQFMWSVIIGRLLWSGTIIQHRFITRLRRRVDIFTGCRSWSRGWPLVLV